MKLRLINPDIAYLNDVREIPHAFYPHIVLDNEADNFLEWACEYSEGKFYVKISSDVLGSAKNSFEINDGNILLYKKFTKRFLKNFLYDFLSEKLKITLPYGSLTGVRPTKIYYDYIDRKDIKGFLKSEFKISESRVSLIEECVQNQKGIINTDDNTVGLFLNIPFCPTRCSYCSFISTEIGRVKKVLPEYMDNVKRETEAVIDMLQRSGKKVTSVYFGGGTPLSIGSGYLGELLKYFKNFKVEFTVEGGRPDCFSEEIIGVLKEGNVTRISVNPQSFCQRTLDLIGRKHTVESVYKAFEIANGKFDINMDLIAGLPEENEEDFNFSLSECINLRPQNITLHTLSLKRGSVLTESGVKKSSDGVAAKMMENGIERLHENGYFAYYMYRQKNTADNLENVGFCKNHKQCKYNIDMMEESQSIVGIGAGAMTKIISDGIIKRIANPKFPKEYGDRILDIAETKGNLFL